MPNFIYISLLSLALSFFYAKPANFKEMNPTFTKAIDKEQIILFTQSSDKLFISKTLMSLRAFCQEKNIELIEKNAQEGLPAEITTTPTIIFQNYKGRSVFSGRYTEWSSIVNFIRTSRFLPVEQAEKDCKEQVFVYKKGRTTLFAPLKITELTGELPSNFNQVTFQANMQKEVASSLQQFKQQASACKNKTDRAFYMDLHPYRNKNGSYNLTIELFSQFSCIVPVFSNKGNPLQNADINLLIQEGAARLEKEIFAQLQNSMIGDAVSFVDGSIAEKNWVDLGLILPQAPSISPNTAISPIEIPQKWQYAGATNPEIPVLQFRFFAPLDRYVGEVKTIKGSMKMANTQAIESGDFEVDMLSLTMGVADFDQKIHHKYIKADKYPKASFHFEQIALPTNLQLGQSLTVPIKGKITFMEKVSDLVVNTIFTPVLDENQAVVMEVSNRFQLNIMQDYGIKGPDGPKNASENVDFFMNFKLTSK